MVTEILWHDAIHFKPNLFHSFWTERLDQKRNILIIVGLGWDPRMTALTDAIHSIGGAGLREIHLLRFKPSPSFVSPYANFISKNSEILDQILENWAEKSIVDIITRREGNFYIGDEGISQFYSKFNISQFTDVLVDISSLPKSLYFTLLFILVKMAQRENKTVNVFAIACQDAELDGQILESADDTRLLKGFKGQLTQYSKKTIPIIWAPVIEKNNTISLRKIYDKIEPQDVYPVLPFPSRNPRNDDDLLIEYRKIFCDEWNLNPMNIIYSAEDDPIDVYSSLINLYHQQQEVLEPLGGISMVISALASKVSSIGAFMAAFDGEIAIAHAIGRHDPPEQMDISYWDEQQINRFKDNLHSIWLTGEPYEL